MGSQNFMADFLNGWNQGLRTRAMKNAEEQEQYQRQQDEFKRQQEMEDRQIKMNEYKLAMDEYKLKMKALQHENALKDIETRRQAQQLQGLPQPTAAEIGIPEQSPDMGGPPAAQINVPQPTQNIPALAGGPDIQMPIPTAQQQQEMAARQWAEELLKKRQEKTTEYEAAEPFKISDDERAAALAAQRDAATERRYQARLDAETKKKKGDATKLRTEYNTQLKPYKAEVDQYNKAKALASVPDEARTPADDIALVFLFMKAQDPGSTVREGEYATAKNAAGVPERLRNLYNATVKGTFLTPEQRKSFGVAIERNFMAGPGRSVEAIQKRYDFLARESGIDPQLVLSETGLESNEQSPDAGWETVAGVKVRRKGAR